MKLSAFKNLAKFASLSFMAAALAFTLSACSNKNQSENHTLEIKATTEVELSQAEVTFELSSEDMETQTHTLTLNAEEPLSLELAQGVYTIHVSQYPKDLDEVDDAIETDDDVDAAESDDSTGSETDSDDVLNGWKEIEDIEVDLSQDTQIELVFELADADDATDAKETDDADDDADEADDADDRTSTSTSSSSKQTTTSTSNSSKNASSSSNSSSNSSSSSSGSSSGYNHQHNWVMQTATIHHVATYDYIWHDAVYEYLSICNNCGANITGNTESHIYNSLMNGGKCGSWHTEPRVVQQGWQEAILVKDAWDEVIETAYKCTTCGAIQ